MGLFSLTDFKLLLATKSLSSKEILQGPKMSKVEENRAVLGEGAGRA